MDLLGCSDCEHRFYVSGLAGTNGRPCPQCGGDLIVEIFGMTSIPLDARMLDTRVGAAEEVTVVDLRQKRRTAGTHGRRIVMDLSAYFAVKSSASAVQVWVNRGIAADAALRVAAVLDGIDDGWEEHFYLPTNDVDGPSEGSKSAPVPARGHLQLVEEPSVESDPGDRDVRLTPTQNSRMRPNALDLGRAFD
jgi:hypothetical protein